MDRSSSFKDDIELEEFYVKLKKLHAFLGSEFLENLDRLPSFSDMLVDRWEKAKMLDFGENSNIYDNSLVIGKVKVGKECWIGPNTILDGSGQLTIGDYCTVSAGCQIYTHDNVMQTLSSKKNEIDRSPTFIGNNVYLGPNVVIARGSTIGNYVVIGANSFVKNTIEDYSIYAGNPARKIGVVEIAPNNVIKFNYNKI